MQNKTNLKLASSRWTGSIALAVVIFGSAASTLSSPGINRDALATRQVKDIHIKEQFFSQALSALALCADIPIGLELAAHQTASPVKINFDHGTVAELMDLVVSQDDQYSWEFKDGVVNVFPKIGQREPAVAMMLSTRLGPVAIKPNTSTWTLEEELASRREFRPILRSHRLKASGSNPSGFYIPQLGKDLSLNIDPGDLRSTLNQVIFSSPTARFWSLGRVVYFNAHRPRLTTERRIVLLFDARSDERPMCLPDYLFDLPK
jgi:hypothetical protein